MRYLDFDGTSLYSREGATDYNLWFVDRWGNLAPGTPVTIFEYGWTTATCVDNYLVRWRSPFDAVGLYVFGNSEDLNCQIDAVMVAAVPEPATLMLAGLAILVWFRRHRR